MDTIAITFEIDQSKKRYEKYFKFERNREFKKVPIKLLFGCYVVLIVTGLVSTVYDLYIQQLISENKFLKEQNQKFIDKLVAEK